MPGLTIATMLVLGALAATGAWLDFRYRQLPNWLCLATFCGAVAAGFLLHDAAWVGMGLLHALLALAIGMVLFAAQMIGGGDAKFYAAVAAWVPLKFGLSLLAAVSLAGLVLLAIWFPVRRRVANLVGDVARKEEFKKVPYGVAISAGGVIAFLWTSDLWQAAPVG